MMGLRPYVPRASVELDGAVHVAVVGDGKARRAGGGQVLERLRRSASCLVVMVSVGSYAKVSPCQGSSPDVSRLANRVSSGSKWTGTTPVGP